MEVDTSDHDLPDMETVENVNINVDQGREGVDEQIGIDQGAHNIIPNYKVDKRRLLYRIVF